MIEILNPRLKKTLDWSFVAREVPDARVVFVADWKAEKKTVDETWKARARKAGFPVF